MENFNYTININQYAAIKAGAIDDNLKVSHLIILDTIKGYYATDGITKSLVDGTLYVWAQNKMLANDNPLLGISDRAVKDIVLRLVKKGYLKKAPTNKSTRKQFVALTKKGESVFFFDSTSTDKRISTSTDKRTSTYTLERTENISTNTISKKKASWDINAIYTHLEQCWIDKDNFIQELKSQTGLSNLSQERIENGIAFFKSKLVFSPEKGTVTSYGKLIRNHFELLQALTIPIRNAADNSPKRAVSKQKDTGRPNSKTRDIQYIQNAKDTLLRVRGELVGNNTIQALEQKNILVQNESKYLNKLDHLTNIKLEHFKDNDCISEYFLFDLLYSNTFHYLRKSFRVIGDNVEDHILVKGTINKFKKKLFNELSDYNQSKGDIYKLAYKHHKKTQL